MIILEKIYLTIKNFHRAKILQDQEQFQENVEEKQYSLPHSL